MDNITCTHCQKKFSITERERTQYKQIDLIEPDICVKCRWQQHFAFWPFGKFRYGKSDLSGENFITILPQNSRYPIYTSKEWWSDKWDPMDYGLEVDFAKSFFEQLKDLQEKIPRPHQQGTSSVDCDWCDDVWDSKSSYLSRSIAKTEGIYYGYRVVESKDSMDVSHVYTLDQCYDCTFCFHSYNLYFSQNCHNCIDSSFLYDCRNCTDCFMCFNLRGKQYCIENIQYTKEEYFEKMKENDLSSFKSLQKIQEKYKNIIKEKAVHKENFNIKTYNSEGSFMTNCNNCINVLSWEDSENCTNCLRGLKAKDCIDLTGCWQIELSGNNSCATGGYKQKYSSWSDGRFSEYLDLCTECENCFGCIGLRNKSYCILNKQYTKEQYEVLVSRIKENMIKDGIYGQFLPYSMALCDYIFSTGMIYIDNPNKELIEKLGGYWDTFKQDSVEGKSTLDIPDSILETEESICTEAFICEKTGWRFNFAKEELAFLKRKKIALPRTHFDFRTKERMKYLAVCEQSSYACTYCKKNIQAYYPKDWDYKNVSCEECYLKNIA